MKRELGYVLGVALAMTASNGILLGCAHRQSRSDWRARPAKPCSSDADCGGEKCAVEPGATEGTCPLSARLPPLPPGGGADGGPAGPGGPARPDIQPSSTDIKL